MDGESPVPVGNTLYGFILTAAATLERASLLFKNVLEALKLIVEEEKLSVTSPPFFHLNSPACGMVCE